MASSGGPTVSKCQLGIPPRWKRCPRKGQLIAEKFVPFKTPLCDMYDSQVPDIYRFTVEMLFKSVHGSAGPTKGKIGLWIDLTNTDRFYSKEDVQACGAVYKKFNCKGHGESPSANVTRAFIDLVKEHVGNHPRDLIAIHCTHGFNRSGFLICAYLVLAMDWSIEAAVQAFVQSRPPGIYKQDYLRALFERYGELDDCPDAPVLPDWCNEDDPLLDDNEAEAVCSSSQPQSSNGMLKTEPEFDPPGISGVSAVMELGERSRLQKKIRQMTNHSKNDFPGSQPVSMDRDNMQKLVQKDYWVSWKADGTRYLMLIEEEAKVFMFDRDNNPFLISNIRFPHRKETRDQSRHVTNTLIDGEMVMDRLNNSDPVVYQPRFLIYDIVSFENEKVGNCDLGKRFQCIDHELIKPRTKAMEEGRIHKEKQPFSVRCKLFKGILQGIPEFLKPGFQESLPHEVDGLIFQPHRDPYCPGRCHEVLKWKPHYMNSVDFKLKIMTEKREGMLTERIGYLMLLGMPHPFATIKVTKQLMELDNKIIECKFANNKWELMRERRDKSFPNAYRTAVGVCNSITNPVTKDMLMDMVKSLSAAVAARAANHHNNNNQNSRQKRPYPDPLASSSASTATSQVGCQDGTPFKRPSLPPPPQFAHPGAPPVAATSAVPPSQQNHPTSPADASASFPSPATLPPLSAASNGTLNHIPGTAIVDTNGNSHLDAPRTIASENMAVSEP